MTTETPLSKLKKAEESATESAEKLPKKPTIDESILSFMKARYPEKNLTLADVARVQNKNKTAKQALFEKYHALYPAAKISDFFLFEIRKYDSEIDTCNKCTGYPCVKTINKGIKPVIQLVQGELTICTARCRYSKAAQSQSKADKAFSAAKIPKRFVGKTFADYEVDAGNKAAVDIAKKLDSCYIYGGTGTGKTFLASIVAQELLQQGKSVIFGDVPTVLDQLKSTFDDGAKTKFEDLMKMLSEVDMLILDDFGTEKPSDWAAEKLYTIINNRYNADKNLIITSNFNLKELKNYYSNSKDGNKGNRIISRICELCTITQLNGTDRRATKFRK